MKDEFYGDNNVQNGVS